MSLKHALENLPIFKFSKPACSCSIFQYSGLLLLSHHMLTACSIAEYSAISTGSILQSSWALVQTYCGIPHPSKNLFRSGMPLGWDTTFLTKVFLILQDLCNLSFPCWNICFRPWGGSTVGWRSRPTPGVGSRSDLVHDLILGHLTGELEGKLGVLLGDLE